MKKVFFGVIILAIFSCNSRNSKESSITYSTTLLLNCDSSKKDYYILYNRDSTFIVKNNLGILIDSGNYSSTNEYLLLRYQTSLKRNDTVFYKKQFKSNSIDTFYLRKGHEIEFYTTDFPD